MFAMIASTTCPASPRITSSCAAQGNFPLHRYAFLLHIFHDFGLEDQVPDIGHRAAIDIQFAIVDVVVIARAQEKEIARPTRLDARVNLHLTLDAPTS